MVVDWVALRTACEAQIVEAIPGALVLAGTILAALVSVKLFKRYIGA